MQARLVLPARRTRAAWLLVGSAAFVAAGAWMLGEKPLLGWAAIAFFGLGLVLGIVLLARPGLMRLVLDDEGFEMASPVRVVRVPWSAVDGFEVVRKPARMIAIHYRADYLGQAGGRAFARELTGIEGGIPDLYAKPLDALLPVLDAFLLRHRERHGG